MIFVYIAEGFEELEALTPVDVLRRADLEVALVSIETGLRVKGAHGVEISCDMLLAESEKLQTNMIVLPGGMPGALGLSNCQPLLDRIVKENQAKTTIAAICAAPMVLGKAGVLQGKNATIYPGMENELNGAKPSTEKVCIDGNIITSQGPATAMAFAFALLEVVSGKEKSDTVKKSMLVHG